MSPSEVVLSVSNGVTLMHIDGVYWMSDEPEEHEIQRTLAAASYGRVLAAGLGFGLYQTYALANPRVQSVTTVEINPEVVTIARKMSPQLFEDPRHSLVMGNFWEMTATRGYNTVYGDIWPSADDFWDRKVWDRFVAHATGHLSPLGVVIGWHRESLAKFDPRYEIRGESHAQQSHTGVHNRRGRGGHRVHRPEEEKAQD